MKSVDSPEESLVPERLELLPSQSISTVNLQLTVPMDVTYLDIATDDGGVEL